jgi:hypothetical protein
MNKLDANCYLTKKIESHHIVEHKLKEIHNKVIQLFGVGNLEKIIMNSNKDKIE